MTGAPARAARLDAAIDALLRDEAYPRVLGREADLLDIARLLRDSLPRSHPRFTFTERLAERLARAARGAEMPPPGPGETRSRSLVLAALGPRGGAPISPLPHRALGMSDARIPGVTGRRRGLVAGGAIASGVSLAIPIAGAALWRWRRSRGSGGAA